MFDKWNEPPTLDEIIGGLRIALPGGEVTPTSITNFGAVDNGFLAKEFHFFQYRFLFRGETVTGSPVYTVYWAAGPRHLVFTDSLAFHDTCEVLTDEDLLGWTSYVRGEIERLALMPFIRNLDPGNLFPDGSLSIEENLSIPWNTLIGCGITDLAPLLKVHLSFPWVVSDKEDAIRFHLPLHTNNGDGYFAGKLTTVTSTTGVLKYGYEIPIPFDLKRLQKDPNDVQAKGKLTGKDETTISVAHSTVQASHGLLVGFFQDWLNDVYLEKVLGYVKQRIQV